MAGKKTKDREIYFFYPILKKYNKIDNKYDDINQNEYSNILKEIFVILNSLSDDINQPNSIYELKKDGSCNFMKIDFFNDSFIYGRLINAPNEVYPDLLQDNKIENLATYISPKSKLIHYTHFVIAIKENFVAIEYNNVGTRYQSLVSYINNKISNKYRFDLYARINENLHNKLSKTKILKDFTFALAKEDYENANNASNSELCIAYNGVVNALCTNNNIPDDMIVEIRVKTRKGFIPKPSVKDDISLWATFWNDKYKDIKNNRLKNKLSIVGYSEKDENLEFDMLRKTLKASKVKAIIKDNNTLDSDDLYEKMIEEYRKLS